MVIFCLWWWNAYGDGLLVVMVCLWWWNDYGDGLLVVMVCLWWWFACSDGLLVVMVCLWWWFACCDDLLVVIVFLWWWFACGDGLLVVMVCLWWCFDGCFVIWQTWYLLICSKELCFLQCTWLLWINGVEKSPFNGRGMEFSWKPTWQKCLHGSFVWLQYDMCSRYTAVWH